MLCLESINNYDFLICYVYEEATVLKKTTPQGPDFTLPETNNERNYRKKKIYSLLMLI